MTMRALLISTLFAAMTLLGGCGPIVKVSLKAFAKGVDGPAAKSADDVLDAGLGSALRSSEDDPASGLSWRSPAVRVPSSRGTGEPSGSKSVDVLGLGIRLADFSPSTVEGKAVLVYETESGSTLVVSLESSLGPNYRLIRASTVGTTAWYLHEKRSKEETRRETEQERYRRMLMQPFLVKRV